MNQKVLLSFFVLFLLVYPLSAQTYRQQYQYNSTGGRTQRVRQTVRGGRNLVMATVPDTAKTIITDYKEERYPNPLGLSGESDTTPANPGSLIVTQQEKDAWMEKMMAELQTQKPFPITGPGQRSFNDYDVGAIPLQYGISPSGARTYSVPIITAPDIKYAPSVSLEYNSQGGFGYGGYGWTLGGLSEIRIVAKSAYFDGENIAPSAADTSSVFALDGVRLVTNDDAATSSIFPLVTARGHILVKPNTTAAGYVKSFTVCTPDGVTATFGLGMDSPTCNYPSYPILNSTNLDGDRIEYEYSSPDSDGNYTPVRIKYGFNTQGVASGVIQFTSTGQTGYYYYAGKKVLRPSRLTRIVSSSGGTNLCTYGLSYTTVPYGAHLLTTITLSAPGGRQVPPLSFTYGFFTIPHTVTDTLKVTKVNAMPDQFNPGSLTQYYRRGKFVKGSYNDGLLGVISAATYTKTGALSFACNYPGNYNIVFAPSICDSDTTGVIAAESGFQAIEAVDVDGDGLEEVVKVNCVSTNSSGSVYVIKTYKSNDDGVLTLTGARSVSLSGSILSGGNSYSPYRRTFRWGDFCGNGKTQLLVVSYDDNGYDVNQTPYYSLIDLSNGSVLFNQTISSIIGNVKPDEDNRLVCVDLDGDSRTELCIAVNGGLQKYKYSAAGGFQLENTFTILPKYYITDPNVCITDINADGYIDFIKVPASGDFLDCKMNTGLGFVQKNITIGPKGSTESVFFMDINRDGYPDMVKLGPNLFQYALNRDGASFTSWLNSNSTITYLQGVLPANVMDYTSMSSFITVEGHFPAEELSIKEYGFTTYAPEQRQLVQSQDSFGKVMRNTYEYLPHASRIWTSNPSGVDTSMGYQLRTLPIYVLTAAKEFLSGADEAPILLQDTYAWYDGVVNTRGLGFCGFMKSRTASFPENPVVIQVNHFNPQRLNIPVSSVSYLDYETHAPFSVTVYTFDNHSTTFGKMAPRLTQTLVNDNVKGVISITSYTYDSFDYPTQVVTGKRIGSSGSTLRTKVTTTYSHSNNPSTYVLGAVASSQTLTERDGNMNTMMGNRSVFTYDAAFHPLTQKDYFVVNSTASLVKSSRWTYDSHGNVLTEESAPYSATEYVGTSYTYDNEGRHLLSSTNELGQTTTYFDFNVYGSPRLVRDFRNRSKTLSYDKWGNQTKTVYADGTVDSTATAWGGESLFTVTHTVTGRPATISHYDAMSREVLTGNQRFDGQWQYIKKYYDGKGRLSRVSMPYRGTSPLYYTNYQYDDYNRLTRVTEASGRITTRSYNGTSVTETKDGIAITRTANALGDIVSGSDAAGTITYTLRDDGQPSSVTAPGGVTTTFTYDAFGRRTNLSDPSAGSRNTSYTWNSDGSSVTTETNDIGTVATHVDKYGRVTDVIRTGTGAFDTQYTYNIYGQLTAIVSTNSTRQDYTYDGYDRVVTEKESAPDSKWLQKTYSYGNGSRISSIQYTSQSGTITTENYVYSNGHNTGISLSDGTTVLTITGENNMGQPTSATTGNVSRTYTYTAYGYPSSRKLMCGNVTLQHAETAFNPLTGNLTSRVYKSSTPNVGEGFLYDNLGRLTRERSNVIAYDAKGSITSKGAVGTMDYTDTSHPYQTITLNAADVSVTRPNTQTITYASYDRPLTLSEGGPVASFTYDANYDRKRMQVVSSGATILKKYYLGDCYEREEAPTATTERLFVGGDAYSAPMVLQRTGTGAWTAYVIGRDYLGSITHIATTTGTLVAEYNYDAWGRMRVPATLVTYAATAEPSLLLGRGYCGHEHLPAFGLINMNARLYDPVLGRFISPDPYIQAPDFSQNFNRYAYALNNPLKYNDKTGEFPWLIPIIAGAIVGAYSGGVIANNGQLNPLKWDWSSSTTYWYMFGGALVGGLSGYVGSMIATSGIPMANTVSIMASSLTNSIGTWTYTGGQTPITISFGFASYDFTNKQWGFLGKKGNSVWENIGYGLGALANGADLLAGWNPGDIQLQTESVPNGDGRLDLIGHSQLLTTDGQSLIDFGPTGNFWGFEPGRNDWVSHSSSFNLNPMDRITQTIQIPNNLFKEGIIIRGANLARLQRISSLLNTNPGFYNFALRSCSSVVARALTLSGVPMIGTHPYLLLGQAYLWSNGLRPWSYCYSFQ